jgi:hypothetical protein
MATDTAGLRHSARGFTPMTEAHTFNIDALLDTSGLGPLLVALPSWLGDFTGANAHDVSLDIDEILSWDFGITNDIEQHQHHSMRSNCFTGEPPPQYYDHLILPAFSLPGSTRDSAGIYENSSIFDTLSPTFSNAASTNGDICDLQCGPNAIDAPNHAWFGTECASDVKNTSKSSPNRESSHCAGTKRIKLMDTFKCDGKIPRNDHGVIATVLLHPPPHEEPASLHSNTYSNPTLQMVLDMSFHPTPPTRQGFEQPSIGQGRKMVTVPTCTATTSGLEREVGSSLAGPCPDQAQSMPNVSQARTSFSKRPKVRRSPSKKGKQTQGQEEKIKRPPNKFFIYQRDMQSRCRVACAEAVADTMIKAGPAVANAAVVRSIRETFHHLNEASFQEKLAPLPEAEPWHRMFGLNKFPVNQQLAKLIGLSWRLEGAAVKAQYTIKQEAAAAAHKVKYPNYTFRPVHAASKNPSKAKSPPSQSTGRKVRTKKLRAPAPTKKRSAPAPL